jgi:hypothetical protein
LAIINRKSQGLFQRPGQFKGVAFRKGHIVRKEDIPHLRRLGKEHLFVLHIGPGEIHEDKAALRLAKALTGQGVVFDGQPSEGKINLKAAHKGLLKVNVQALTELCHIPAICCASRHINVVVEKGEIVCATRAIPLIIDEMTLSAAVHIAEAAGGIFSAKPLSQPKTGIVITGNEVYSGLINDKFAPILRKKLASFGREMPLPRMSFWKIGPIDYFRLAIDDCYYFRFKTAQIMSRITGSILSFQDKLVQFQETSLGR